MSYVIRFIAWAMPVSVAHALFRALCWSCAKLPRNDYLWCYTIVAKDGRSPYLTRCLFPRWRGRRVMLHWIHRADQDQDMHNHPWAHGVSRVLTGWYNEQRMVAHPTASRSGHVETTFLFRKPGDEPHTLDQYDFHRIDAIDHRGPTWTLFEVGERVQEWGFLVDGKTFVPWQEYFRQKGIEQDKVAS